MNDHFENLRQSIAVELIKEWKANESKLMSQYGSREDFFSDVMAKRLWRSAKVREEFSDFSTLEAFLANETRAKTHKRDITTHRQPETLHDDTTTDDGIKSKWDADPSLRKEFENDYQGYLAYESNKHRVKTM